MRYSLDEVSQTLHAQPKGFNAGFAVALPAEKATEHGNLPDEFARRGRVFWNSLLRQNISTFPLDLGEERAGVQVGMGSAQLDQTGQSPGNHQIHRQCQFQLGDAALLQRFNPATILEHMEEGLDFPAAAIPVDQLDHGFKAFGRPVGQQTPFHRFATGRGVDFPGNQQVADN